MNLIPIVSPFFLDGELPVSAEGWDTVFGNDNERVFEIGCGTGDFAVSRAAQEPFRNYLALDYYNKGCLKTCKKVAKAGLVNVRVIRAEARSFIEEHLPAGGLAAVYINCPDPWPKKRHRKRRLVQAEFVTFLGRYLRDGGDFFFATDFDDYGLDVAAFMEEVPGFRNMLAPDPYRYALAGYPSSKYMQKFMAEGKQIYYVHYRKTE